MSLVNSGGRPRVSDVPRSSSSPESLHSNRRVSLKELPSYREEASQALNRGEELQRIKDRLSSYKEILNADPSTKPWLRRLSHRQEGLPIGDETATNNMFDAPKLSRGQSAPSAQPGLRARNQLREQSEAESSLYSAEADYNY